VDFENSTEFYLSSSYISLVILHACFLIHVIFSVLCVFMKGRRVVP
jgi:hypothetical protein